MADVQGISQSASTREAPSCIDGPAAPSNEALPSITDVALTNADEVLSIIRTGLVRRFSGELQIYGDTALGRVYLYDGCVAWAHCTTHPENLGNVLRREADVSDDAFVRAMEHCRLRGGKLGHALIRLGLVSHKELKRCLWLHVGTHLRHVLAMRGALRASFELDSEHHYDRSLLLSLEDALECAGLWR